MLEPTVRLMGIEEYRLPNGLRVVLAPDASKPTFTLNMTVLVGSIHEGAGEAGMAHVFEHMLFRRLDGFPDVKETLQRMGSHFNGATTFDRTFFTETAMDEGENLDMVLRLEAARLMKAELREEDLEAERRIVESEFDLGSMYPKRLLVRGMLGSMYAFHAYSRDPIGTVEDFRSLRIPGIKDFYERYYTPGNTVLSLTGRFDRAKALLLVEHHFGSLQETGRPVPPYTTREPDSRGERRFAVRGPGDARYVIVAYRGPGACSPDAAAALALAHILGTGETSVLHKEVVVPGLASSVQAGFMGLSMPSPWFALAAVPLGKDWAGAEKAIVDILEGRLAALTEADVERARNLMEMGYQEIRNSPEMLSACLSECEAAGSWKLLAVRRELAKALTLDQLRNFAIRYMKAENRVTGLFEPGPAPVAAMNGHEPVIGDYTEMLANVAADAPVAAEFSYTPTVLQGALAWKTLGPLHVGLIAKPTNGDEVFLRIRIPFAGREAVHPSYRHGKALADIMTERTSTLSKEALESALAAHQASIGVELTLNRACITVKAKRDRLGAGMAIVREMLRTPHITKAQVSEYVAQQQAALRSIGDNPMILVALEANRMLFPPGDLRRYGSPEEQIADLDKVTPESLEAFHGDFFGADGLRAAVVGELNFSELEEGFAPLMDGWKARMAFHEEPNPAVSTLAYPARTVQIPGKPMAFNVLIQPLKLRMTSPDFAPLVHAATILFSDPLSSRISRKVREEAGLSYVTQGQLQADLEGDFAHLLILAATSPTNAEAAVGMIKAELDLALAEGVSEDEVSRIKTSIRNGLAVTRANDEYIARELLELNHAGLDFRLWAKYDEQAASLSASEVNDALRRHLKSASMGLLRIGDFEAKG